MEDFFFAEEADEAVAGRTAKIEAFLEFGGGDKGFLVEVFDDSSGVGGGATEGGDFFGGFLSERKERTEGLGGRTGGLDDGDQEEAEPVAEVVGFADLGQGVVVVGAVFFEVLER